MTKASSCRFPAPLWLVVLLTVLQLQAHYSSCFWVSATVHVELGKSSGSSSVAVKRNLTIAECSGSAQDCLIGDLTELEFLTDSHSSRRILQANNRPLTYGTNNGNSPTCSGNGKYSTCLNQRNGNAPPPGCNDFCKARVNA